MTATAFLPHDEVTWREYRDDVRLKTGTVVPADDPRLTAAHLDAAHSGRLLPIQLTDTTDIWMVERLKLQKTADIERRCREELLATVESARRAAMTLGARIDNAPKSGVHLNYSDAEAELVEIYRRLRSLNRIVQEEV